MSLFTTHCFTVDVSVISSIQHVKAISRTFPAKIVIHNREGLKIVEAEYQNTNELAEIYVELRAAWLAYTKRVKAGTL